MYSFERYAGGISADCVTATRDGQGIAYTTYPNGELWRSRVDGTERLQLTARPQQAPQWSPDGKRLAYMVREADGPWRIYNVDANGGEPREAGGGAGPEADPSWSPNGQRLAFAAFPWDVKPDAQQIRILDVASGVFVTAVPGSAAMFSPTWTPEGGGSSQSIPPDRGNSSHAILRPVVGRS